MKNIILLVMALCLTSNLLPQDLESVGTTDYERLSLTVVNELNIEKELSNWIRALLYPIVGDVIAIVDINLKYPSGIERKIDLDRAVKLPAIPVLRTTDISNKLLQTEIDKVLITVFVDRETSKDKIDLIRRYLNKWFKFDHARGDKINILKMDNLFTQQTIQRTILKERNINWYIMMLSLLVILIGLIVVIPLSMRRVGNAFGSQLSKRVASATEPETAYKDQVFPPSPLERAKERFKPEDKGPMPVKIVSDTEEIDKTAVVDFSFLDNLKRDELMSLLGDESIENIAILLSQLQKNRNILIENMLQNYSEKQQEELLTEILNLENKKKSEIVPLRERLMAKLKRLKEEEHIIKKTEEELISIINSSDYETSERLANLLKERRPEVWGKIRGNVFLAEDIIDIDDRILEAQLLKIDRPTLAIFLSVCSAEVMEKIYKNMSSRAISIIREDINALGKIPKKEETRARNKVLQILRKV